MDTSLTLILTGLLSMLFAELYRPWNKPNPHARDDLARFWGFESWRWTAVAMSYFRPIGRHGCRRHPGRRRERPGLVSELNQAQ